MNDRLLNRLSMFQTCLGTLNENTSVWRSKDPLVFTAKVEQFATAVAELESMTRQQEADTSGAARDKRRATAELQQTAHLFGSMLAIWFSEQRDEGQAVKVNLTLSDWRRLRGQQMLEKARLVRDLAQPVVESESDAAFYGLTEQELATLEQKISDFAAVIAEPQLRIAQRKARTSQLPEKVREITQILATLDRLILSFRKSDEERNFVAAYRASRNIRNHGRRSSANRQRPTSTTTAGAPPTDPLPTNQPVSDTIAIGQ